VKCRICTHVDRSAIDKAIVGGTSLRDIAGQFGVSRSAVDRHKGHITKALAEARKTEVKEIVSLRDRAERVLSRLEILAERSRDPKDWLPAIRAIELLGKFSGELQSGTQIAIINGRPAKTVIVGSPEWEESFRDFVDAVLEDEPAELGRLNEQRAYLETLTDKQLENLMRFSGIPESEGAKVRSQPGMTTTRSKGGHQ
jgi:hypothetical protein